MTKLRYHNWDRYKLLIDECSNLSCSNYSQLEIHHIIPRSAGGSNEFDNIIILCRDCHMNSENRCHSDWRIRQSELRKWKAEVDSHLIYDENHRRWYSDIDLDHIEETKNESCRDFIYWNKAKQWEDRGSKSFCYGCGKWILTYKFGNGFFCIDCIMEYMQSLDNSIIDELLPKIPNDVRIVYNNRFIH